jgi:hypothetical protein
MSARSEPGGARRRDAGRHGGAAGRPPQEDEERGPGDTGDARRPPGPTDRDETPAERADRNFAELVQELRVAQTGVQILFAFLLSLPFLTDFPHTPDYERVLTGALLASAGATICFVAPVAFHRTLFRQGMKEEIVNLTHRLAAIGLGLLALAMALASWLVLAAVWTNDTATAVAVGMLVVVVVVWVIIPRAVFRRSTGRR